MDSQPPTLLSSIGPADLQPAYDLVARQVARGEMPAAVLAVATPERLVRVGSFAPGHERVTPLSNFMIASITKPILATAVLQLAAAGLLDLDAPVQEYLPEFRPAPAAGAPANAEPITARMILSHTAGLGEDWERLRRERPSARRLYAWLCREPLLFPPGTRFRYASNSYFVLGELVARLSGWPYPAYVREHVLEPLEMTATTFELPSHDRAPVHRFGPSPALAPIYVRLFARLEHPGGGLWSNAHDVVRFGRAMLRGGELEGRRVLGPAWLAEMTRLQTAGLVDDEDPTRRPDYALGWGRSGLDPNRPGTAAVFDHGGNSGGRLWVDPQAGLVIVYLANRWGSSSRHALEAIEAVYDAVGAPRSMGTPTKEPHSVHEPS